MKSKIIVLIAIITWLVAGCIKNNPNPSWIKIEPFTLSPNSIFSGGEGSLDRQGLTNGWVYINGKFIGIFELPCKIPVMVYGDVVIDVYPTILNNGVHATKKLYPFTDVHTQSIHLSNTDTVTVSPTTKYLAGTYFWVEDFEGSTIRLTNGANSLTTILPVTDTEIDNNRIGRVTLTPTENHWSSYISFEHSDQTPFTFPLGTEVYLEFDIKNTHPVKTSATWLKADGSTGSQYHFGASAFNQGWKKMYIDFTEIVAYSQGTSFWFGLSCDLPEGESEATILIDNIKLISR